MNFLAFKKKLEIFPVFSYNEIKKMYPNFYKQRLVEWQKKNYIQHIRRGFYRFTDKQLNQTKLFTIANKIYKPSYISLETALQYYNLTPEGVFSLTSITTKKTKTFNTPVGNFIYRSIKPELFFGYKIVSKNFLIADIHKTILDYLYINKNIKTQNDFKSIRLNNQVLKESINKTTLIQYTNIFDSKTLTKRVNIFLTHARL